eukprot:c37311_g1_i1 orf=133-291(+)
MVTPLKEGDSMTLSLSRYLNGSQSPLRFTTPFEPLSSHITISPSPSRHSLVG